MRVSIKRSLEGLLVAGAVAFGSVTPGEANGGGHGGTGAGMPYFIGITGAGGGDWTQPAAGSFEAHNPDVVQPTPRHCKRRSMHCHNQ
jgi:hypothetical protein